MPTRTHKEKENGNAHIIWAVAVLFLVFLGSYFLFKNIGTYDYEGLTFTKEMFGQIPVYHYYYIYNDESGQLVQNNIYLRTNPEKNDVPIEGKIEYSAGKFVYVSINGTAMEGCSAQSGIALSSLASFLSNGGLQVRGGTLDNSTKTGTSANSVNSTTPYITCKTKPDNPVIQIQSGEKTEIINNGMCYNVYFSKCDDVLPAIEKFIMQSIVDAK